MAHAVWANPKSLFRPRTPLAKALGDLPLFSRLSRAEIEKVEAIAHIRTYSAGECIFEQGDPSVAMFVIMAGEVRIVIRTEESEEDREVARLGTGEMFGETALLDGAPRTAAAIAATPAEIAAIARPDWIDLVERQPALGVRMLLPLARVMAARVRALNLQVPTSQQQNWEQYV
ncbi:MAG TPA: cyclic nucleotide-binding domain-containing protein [Candidatus Latescibacteria bacterium]|nr:cyclic nucleotide-binding domain-containing protein [Candidatus Latescibacterota bacterium]HQI77002.1 cyclic nucleotide-binding domain-containing protein [Candidatus Latescibacterota bacterium]HQK22204.1 cyclic nucleotide-binding domain-containing protein [Candidatus Latescibacterota bacterium]